MAENNKIALYILRKDLRLKNNMVLKSISCQGYSIIPIYFWDEKSLKKEKRGSNYRDFLKKSLFSLKKELESNGGYLILVNGGIKNRGISLISKLQPKKIFMQKQFLPWESEEERILSDKFPDKVETINNNYLVFDPGEILKKDGSFYSVFTPFYKKWLTKLQGKNFDGFNSNIVFAKIPKILSGNLFIEEEKLEIENSEEGFLADNRKKANAFLKEKLTNYEEDRDYPFKRGTSELSRYFNLGIISPREIIGKIVEGNFESRNSDSYIRQLAWRDFYYHLYYANPYVLEKAFKKKYENLLWENSPENFEYWKMGLTGYPFVDAGMRQLLQEGFMHNRLRMVVASFLTKDLLINWKKGEKYFMEKLYDGDLILNNGGWQWSSSTGADAQPYFRIFNPVIQSKRFDINGLYIKKYVRELENVPEKFIHEPWKMNINEQKACGVIIGKDYPEPIVDHSQQRLRVLELYRI